MLYLINAQVHQIFYKKSEEKLLLFFPTLFHPSSLLFKSLKLSEEDMNCVTRTMEMYLLAETREYDYYKATHSLLVAIEQHTKHV